MRLFSTFCLSLCNGAAIFVRQTDIIQKILKWQNGLLLVKKQKSTKHSIKQNIIQTSVVLLMKSVTKPPTRKALICYKKKKISLVFTTYFIQRV